MPRKLLAALLLALLGKVFLCPGPAGAESPADSQKHLVALFSGARLEKAPLSELEKLAGQSAGNEAEQWTNVVGQARSYNEFVDWYSRLKPVSNLSSEEIKKQADEIKARVKETAGKLGLAGEEDVRPIIPRYLARGLPPTGPNGPGPRGTGTAPTPMPEPVSTPVPRLAVHNADGMPGDFGNVADNSRRGGSPANEPVAGAGTNPRRSPKTALTSTTSQVDSFKSGGRSAGIDGVRVPLAATLPNAFPKATVNDDSMPESDRLMAGKLRGILAKAPAASGAAAYLKQYEALVASGKVDAAALKAWEKEVNDYLVLKDPTAFHMDFSAVALAAVFPPLGALAAVTGTGEPSISQTENCFQALEKENPNFARSCGKSPIMAAVFAGISDAIIEQVKGFFSLLNGLIMLVMFLIAGLASGGIADLVGLLVTIGFSLYMAYQIVTEYGPKLFSAIKALINAKSGSTESFAKWRETSKLATTTIVMVLMTVLMAKGATKLAGKIAELGGAGAKVGFLKALTTKVDMPALAAEGPGVIPRAMKIRAADPTVSVPKAALTATGQTVTAAATAAKTTMAAVVAKLTGKRPAPEAIVIPKPPAPEAAPAAPHAKTPEMALNQSRMNAAVREQFEATSGQLETVPKGPDAFVKKLQKTDALPESPLPDAAPEVKAGMKARRNEAIADLVQKYEGLKEKPKVTAPETDPLSGAEIYILKNAKGEGVAVVKVFVNNGKGPLTMMNELGAGRELGAQNVKLSRPVDTVGVMAAKDGQIIQIMEAAPGQDYYGVLKELGKLPEGSKARAEALPQVEKDVELAAKALAERHNAAKPGEVSLKSKQSSVTSALKNLEEAKDKIPPDLYTALKARFEELGRRYVDSEVPGTITHGDFHPGNAFRAPEGNSITLIDNETAMRSVGKAGEGINSPLEDAARFVESIRVNNQAKGLNLGPAEISSIENKFLDAYAKDMKIDPAAFRVQLDYYRARLQITALKYAKPESLPGIVEGIKADPALQVTPAGLKAEAALGKPLSPQQHALVQKAHEVGRGETGRDGTNPAGVGNYSLGQLLRKTRTVLEPDSGFDFGDVRTLMEKEVLGDPVTPARPGNILRPSASVAKEVELLKANGAVSDNGLSAAISQRVGELSDLATQARKKANGFGTGSPEYRQLMNEAVELDNRAKELAPYSSAAYSARDGKITAPGTDPGFEAYLKQETSVGSASLLKQGVPREQLRGMINNYIKDNGIPSGSPQADEIMGRYGFSETAVKPPAAPRASDFPDAPPSATMVGTSVRPSGVLRVRSGGTDATIEVTLDRKPGAMQATFLGNDGKGRGVAVKTAQYTGVEPRPEAQARAALSAESQTLSRAGELARRPAFPQNVSVPQLQGLGYMDAGMAKRIYGAPQRVPVMLMKRAAGTTIEAWLDKGQNLNIRDFQGVVQAVKLLHENGIAHGDLNIGNILISENPATGRQSFVILDFGASKVQGATDGGLFASVKANDIKELLQIAGYFKEQGKLKP